MKSYDDAVLQIASDMVHDHFGGGDARPVGYGMVAFIFEKGNQEVADDCYVKFNELKAAVYKKRNKAA